MLVVFRHPSEKYEFVSWDYEIPNIWKLIKYVPNHQPELVDNLQAGRFPKLCNNKIG